MNNIRIYDNGGKTLDRYVVVYMDSTEQGTFTFEARAMSEDPFHWLGFCQMTTVKLGKHLGRRVSLKKLPEDCQKVINSDLECYSEES